MSTLFLDTETFSTVKITHGTHAYAEAAEVMLVPWAWDDDDVAVWDTQDMLDWRSLLQRMVDEADEVVIHNSHFDRTVLRHCGVNIPVDKITDTMVIALQHSLPASLGMLCDVLGVPQDKAKDKAGKKLIQLLTKPRPKNMKLRRATRETHPDEWNAFIEYARLDVDAMRELYRRLPRWNCNTRERELWIADQRINDRGVAVDRQLATAAIRAFERTTRSLATRTAHLTGGVVTSLTQRQKFMDYLAAHHNFAPDDMTKGTVASLLKSDLDPVVRELLEIRQQASATSPAKYKVVLDAASSDGRLRGIIQFCGAARTGRDAGRIFQPQNLPRPTLKPQVIEDGIKAMKLDCEDLLFDNVSELCASSVRGCLVAEPGKKLVVADLSNIEGRVLAWLAGEDWKVKAFYDFDRGVGHDLYKLAYAKSFNKDAEDVTKDERQIGKVQELALGYQGGVGAFNSMAANYGVVLPEDKVMEIVAAWRKAHGSVVSLWYDVERAAISAIRNPDKVFDVRSLRFGMKGEYLCIKLPSGRYLTYPKAHLDWKRELPDGTVMQGPIGYDGVDQFTKQWMSLGTYGGKLCIAQGTLVLTDAGWLPIEHVTSLHKVWDGEEWVPNEGLVRKGVKEVICLNGVWMTPDHEVLTTEGWVRASQSEGLERADARIPAGREVPRKRRSPITVVASMPVWGFGSARSDGDSEAAEARHSGVLRLHAEQDHIGEADNSRHVAPQSLCGVAQHDRQVLAADPSGLGALRRAWDNGVRSVAEILQRLLGRHGTDLPRGPHVGAPRQFRRVQPAELRMGHAHTASPQQADQCAYQHAVGRDDSGRGGGSLGAEPDHAVLPSEHRCAGSYAVRGTRHFAEVYDLVNCGPRSRFVVAGENGDTFIVHNCENIVQAIARDIFMGGMLRADSGGYDVCIRVHDELICETPDDPAYTVEALAAHMTRGESWSTGLPLAAAGHEMRRYAKLD